MSKKASIQPSVKKLVVAARDSPLSKAQVQEVQKELLHFFPDLVFHLLFVKTVGDRDKATSLRQLDKTDFFTREIDALLLRGECRAAIHSAKDLPEPLPKGLFLAALTKGVDPSDALVLPERRPLPMNPLIGTSSVRREEAVRRIFPQARFVDIRGTIGERLEKVQSGELDGVVIAEAALIRLGLTHLNRVFLPGETAKGQGQLAVVVQEGDEEMIEIFKSICVYETHSLSGA